MIIKNLKQAEKLINIPVTIKLTDLKTFDDYILDITITKVDYKTNSIDIKKGQAESNITLSNTQIEIISVFKKFKAYIATHFFNAGGFMYTEKLAKDLRAEFPYIDFYVPQENGEINDKKNNDSTITATQIAIQDTEKLLASQLLIADLDGVEVDAGVASEIGVFAGMLEASRILLKQPMEDKKKIIGIYTDMRKDGTGDNHMYKNLYTKGLVELWGAVVGDISYETTLTQIILEIRQFEKSFTM